MSAIVQTSLFKTLDRSAELSRDRVYRFTLWRRWSDGDRYVQFVCLNPSTADENADDQTTIKCMKLARLWGYDALCMTNLFAYRATDPKVMISFRDPVGFGNDRWLKVVAQQASLVVAAWGLNGRFMGRSKIVRQMLRKFDLHYLRFTRDEPWHPLYLPDNTWPSRWWVNDYERKNS